MIEFSWVHLGFLMLAGFVGSFIDAIVGGGGLITLPAWMATGLPMAYALGSNKMASVVGAITSFTTFMRSGRVDRRMLRYMPLSVIGSVLGAVIASFPSGNAPALYCYCCPRHCSPLHLFQEGVGWR